MKKLSKYIRESLSTNERIKYLKVDYGFWSECQNLGEGNIIGWYWNKAKTVEEAKQIVIECLKDPLDKIQLFAGLFLKKYNILTAKKNPKLHNTNDIVGTATYVIFCSNSEPNFMESCEKWQKGLTVEKKYIKPLNLFFEAIQELSNGYIEPDTDDIIVKYHLTLNRSTNKYDCKRDIRALEDLVKEDKDGFVIEFGRVEGEFRCDDLELVSLKGSPEYVGGTFMCSNNNLTTLEGAPEEVGGSFHCEDCKLVSLKGAPRRVEGEFSAENNEIKSLEGAPEYVGGSFTVENNEIKSLEGAPKYVGSGFSCKKNKVTSLKGAPREVSFFDCEKNQLTTLEGGPEIVRDAFFAEKNKLTSLKGAPKTVGMGFFCPKNQLTTLEGGPEYVGGGFDCSNNKLTSIKGAPKEVGDYFDCTKNKIIFDNEHFFNYLPQVGTKLNTDNKEVNAQSQEEFRNKIDAINAKDADFWDINAQLDDGDILKFRNTTDETLQRLMNFFKSEAAAKKWARKFMEKVNEMMSKINNFSEESFCKACWDVKGAWEHSEYQFQKALKDFDGSLHGHYKVSELLPTFNAIKQLAE